MKKIILLLLTALMLTSFSTTKTSDFSIIGKWEGVENYEVGYFIFDAEGYAYMKVKDFDLGGKDFEFHGKRGKMEYEVDYSKSPIEVDFIVTIFEDNITKRLLCIAKKIDANRMMFSMGFGGDRPTDFNDNNTMIFTRVDD